MRQKALLNGLTAAGKRSDYAVVTGVSTGALMTPLPSPAPHYNDALRKAYTKTTAAKPPPYPGDAAPEASYIEKTDPMKNLSLANTERQRAVRARAPRGNIPIIELLYVNSDRITFI